MRAEADQPSLVARAALPAVERLAHLQDPLPQRAPGRAAHPFSISITGVATSITPVSK